jgi:hypothetical protein
MGDQAEVVSRLGVSPNYHSKVKTDKGTRNANSVLMPSSSKCLSALLHF